MARTRPVAALLAVLLLATPVATYAAGNRVGAPCGKVGVTAVSGGVKIKCTKSNGRMVWKRVSAAKPQPQPEPTVTPTHSPTPSPTPTNDPTKPRDIEGNPTSVEAVVIDRMIPGIWARGVDRSQGLTVNYDSEVKDAQWSKDTTALLGQTWRIIDGIGMPLVKPPTWYVAWSWDSLTPKLPANCWASDRRNFDTTRVGAGYCIPDSIFVVWEAYKQWYPEPGFLEKYRSNAARLEIVHVGAGELTHFSQNEYGQRYGRNGTRFLPAWLREGPTLVYPLMAYSAATGIPYSTLRNWKLTMGFKNCGDVPIESLLTNGTTSSACEYTGGFLATEYMIAKSGDPAWPFHFLESTIPGEGQYSAVHKGIARESYEQVLREMYGVTDPVAWHAELQAYIKKWAPSGK